MEDILVEVIKRVQQAGAILLKHYFTPVEQSSIKMKVDESPLTDADLESHEFLCGELKSLNPGIAIISEEGVAAHEEVPGPFWLIDPLDGTREFIQRKPDFTINVALVENGIVQLGIIHVPIREVTYFAKRDAGAYFIDSQKQQSPIHCRKYDEKAFIGFASQSNGGPEEERLRMIWPQIQIQRMASALKYCLIAQGLADFYVREHACMAWDTAAAQIILEEAGGALIAFDGKPVRYSRQQLANRPFFALGDRNFPWQKYFPAS